MAIYYLEIVSSDVDALTALYQRMHGLSFGPPAPELGQARVATQRTALWSASGSRWRRMSIRSCGRISRSKTSNKQ